MVDQEKPGLERYVNQGNTAYTRLLMQWSPQERIPFLLPLLKPGMRVLDAGCGPGVVTVGIAEAVAPAGEAVGIDLDGEALAMGRELAKERGTGNVRFEEANIFSLPFADATFDVVSALAVLFHLREREAALGELRRVLKPGGIIYVVNPGETVLYPPTALLERRRELNRRTYQAAGVDLDLGPRQRELLLAAGFREPETQLTVLSWGTLSRTRDQAEGLITRFRGQNEAGGMALREGWATEAEVEAICGAIAEWGERPDAFASQVAFHTTARKPS